MITAHLWNVHCLVQTPRCPCCFASQTSSHPRGCIFLSWILPPPPIIKCSFYYRFCIKFFRMFYNARLPQLSMEISKQKRYNNGNHGNVASGMILCRRGEKESGNSRSRGTSFPQDGSQSDEYFQKISIGARNCSPSLALPWKILLNTTTAKGSLESRRDGIYVCAAMYPNHCVVADK